MKSWLTPLLIILALGSLAFWATLRQTTPEAVQVINCKYPVTGCDFLHNGQQSQLRFSAMPKAMKAFSIELYAPAAWKVSARFQMNGMDMGFNRYDFKAERGGHFKAESIMLPVCTQARSDWAVFFSLDDKTYRLNFQAR